MVKTFFNFFICESIGDAIVLLKCLEDFRYKDLNYHMQLHSHIELLTVCVKLMRVGG